MLRLRRSEPAAPLVTAAAPVTPTPAVAAPTTEPRFADYLDRIDAALRPHLAADARASVLRELAQHLEASRAAFAELGETPEQAVESALSRFGDSAIIARRYRRALAATERRDIRAAVGDAWRGYAAGILLFAIVCSLMSLPMETGSLIRFLGRSSGALPLLGIVWFMVPILVGTRAGWRHSRRAAVRGVARAAAVVAACGFPFVILCYSTVIGYVLDDHAVLFRNIGLGAMLMPFLLLLTVWTVVGVLSACVASSARERRLWRRW